MNYQGHQAAVTFDEEVDIFHGEVVNTRDVITFQGRSVDELRTAFKDSVDEYLNSARSAAGSRISPSQEELRSGFRRRFTERQARPPAPKARA